MSGTFTRGLVGNDISCEINLQNSGEIYTGEFNPGDIIKFLMDFSDGSTVQWEGLLENLRNRVSGDGFTLNIKGSHYTSKTLDVNVTAEFNNSELSVILKSLIDNNLTGFTYANVETTTVSTKISWEKKPLLDCIIDLMNFGYECYVDNNKDFHFFLKGSRQNADEAVVWNDTLIELKGLGEDVVDVKNKVIVYGDAGGLPVLHTSQDTDSQITYDVREKILTDSNIKDEDQAQDAGDAEIEIQKNPEAKGTADCFFMPLLNPGDSLYVVSPPHDLTDLFRLVRYTFKVPDEIMEVSFSKDVGIPQLLKDRIRKDQAQESVVNPNKMLFSYNFTFDDLSKINTGASNNVEVVNGKLKMIAAGDAQMTSIVRELSEEVSTVEIKAIGERLDGVTYEVSADNRINYTSISELNIPTSVTLGNFLIVKVIFAPTATTTQIDSLAVLCK